MGSARRSEIGRLCVSASISRLLVMVSCSSAMCSHRELNALNSKNFNVIKFGN